MNNIYHKQTEPMFIELLAAQRRLYSEAKRYNLLIRTVSLLSALAFPLLLSIVPEAKSVVGLIAGLLSVFVVIFLKDAPASKIEQAAKLQEEFDTDLFGLPWNQGLAGPKVPTATRVEAARRLKDRGNLDTVPWYADYSQLDHSHAVLRCQQENLNWSSKLSKRYANFLAVLVGVTIVLGWIWGFEGLQLKHHEYLLQILFPASGLLIHWQQTYVKTLRTSIKLTEMMTSARATADKYAAQAAAIPTEELRSIQDKIFQKRKQDAPVSDWFYNWFKGRDEEDAQATAEALNN